jgi:hypothetical protein
MTRYDGLLKLSNPEHLVNHYLSRPRQRAVVPVCSEMLWQVPAALNQRR